MNHRHRRNRRQAQENSFLRTWRFEGPKEFLGKLVELAGTTAGVYAAAVVNKHGVPLDPAKVTFAGVAFGFTLGAVAKSALAAAFDTVRDRTKAPDDSPSAAAANAPAPRSPGATGPRAVGRAETLGQPPVRLAADVPRPRPGGRRSTRRTYAGRHRASGGVTVAGLTADLESVIELIERNHHHLVGVIDRLTRNHATLMSTLAGGNPTVLRMVDGRVTGARRAIEEACTLLRGSRDQLRGYLRTI